MNVLFQELIDRLSVQGFIGDYNPNDDRRAYDLEWCAFTLWDTGRPVKPFLPPGLPHWTKFQETPLMDTHVFESGKVEVKMKVTGFDAADGFGRSQAEIFARQRMVALIYFLQTREWRGRVFDRHVLASVSRGIGVREERRIVGEHVLTNEEARHAVVFDDAIAVNTYHIDYHRTDTKHFAAEGIFDNVEPYHIPLRALIPKGARNILVPGRGASAEQLAMSSFRVMAVVQAMGYGAGTAVRQCIEDDTHLRDIDIGKLQSTLEANGQSLDLSYYGDYQRKLLFFREHIFEDDRPFDQCHASTLVQLRNSRILAAWFGGAREGDDDVGVWLAERYQGCWSAPRLLAKVKNKPHWNPVLFATPRGQVHLHFKVGQAPHRWRTWIMTSDDEGANWSELRELAPVEAITAGPSKNKPIALKDGTWIAPNSTTINDHWEVFVNRSIDEGATWSRGEFIALNHDECSGKGAIQPTLWESKPGRVHMLVRTTGGRI